MDSKRFRAQIPIIFSRDGVPGETRGLVSNLSADGCKITSNTRVETGTYLNLRLYLPGSPVPMVVRLAAVRWVQGWDFGVTFLNMQTEELQRLNQHLADLEAGGAAAPLAFDPARAKGGVHLHCPAQRGLLCAQARAICLRIAGSTD